MKSVAGRQCNTWMSFVCYCRRHLCQFYPEEKDDAMNIVKRQHLFIQLLFYYDKVLQVNLHG